MTRDGQAVTLPVFHFSGAGVTQAEVALALGCTGVLNLEECEADAFLAQFASDAAQPNPRASLLQDLRFFYANIVVPAFTIGETESLQLGAGSSADREDETAFP